MDPEKESASGNYREGWRRYKQFRKLGVIWWLGWILVIGVYAWLFQKYGDFPLEYLGFYLVLGMVHGVCNAFWICPRCKQFFSNPGRFFLRGSGYDKGIARVCVHCGLPRFAEDDSTTPGIGTRTPR